MRENKMATATEKPPFEEISACRRCDSDDLSTVLNFGECPLANGLRTREELNEPELTVPLEVVLCESCATVQLKHTVEPSILFKDYLYHSGDSGSLRDYFRGYAEKAFIELALEPRDLVVGIGGNDGTLERCFERLECRVLNVEPSGTGARNAHFWLKRWWNEETAREIRLVHGAARLITCNNCFAHMPDVKETLRGVIRLLRYGGTFLVECADLQATLDRKLFDQFYHEHVFYWHEESLAETMTSAGLTPVVRSRSEAQGGSLRMAGVQKGRPPRIARNISDECSKLRDGFLTLRRHIDSFVNDFRAQGELKTLACYGWPAKATLLSKLLGLNSDNVAYAVDEMPSKQGRFTPGGEIEIVNRERFVADPPDYCLIMAGNYEKEIMAANPQFRGKWLTAVPGYQR